MAHRKGLEIDQDLGFQRWEWTAQRVGWWALSAFVAAAALGVFGEGPLSHARAADPSGRLSVEYDRFLRVGARTRLTVRGHATPGRSGPIELRLARDYFDALEIERIVPEPAAIEIAPEEVTLRFDANAVSNAGLVVVVDAQPHKVGWRRGALRTAQGASVSFTQLTYF